MILKKGHAKAEKESVKIPIPHGPEVCGWDNIGNGWFMECLCGKWSSEVVPLMEQVGSQFDDHLRQVGVLLEN